MSRSRDKNETEYLRGIIRKLKKENSQLKRELSKNYQIPTDDDEEEVEYPYNPKKCMHCHIGLMEPVKIFNREFERCTNCNKRTKATINE